MEPSDPKKRKNRKLAYGMAIQTLPSQRRKLQNKAALAIPKKAKICKKLSKLSI